MIVARKLKLDTKYLKGFVADKDLREVLPDAEKAHTYLTEKKGPGNDFLGWVDLPDNVDAGLISDIERTADSLKGDSDVIVVIGIGGSYLGARAAIETLAPGVVNRKIVFAGYNLCGDYLSVLLEQLKNKDVSINVISKSGTTMEPAIAFRVLENLLKEKCGESELRSRIVCTTDRQEGALKFIADKKGYKTFVIPDDIGGRFSVLTPVGLLPMACADIDIRDILEGAKYQRENSLDGDLNKNISYKYAAIRNVLYRKGKRIEVLASFNNRLHYLDEWWKQLFGESEGKDGHSIFPVSCDFSTDLHSMGQLAHAVSLQLHCAGCIGRTRHS